MRNQFVPFISRFRVILTRPPPFPSQGTPNILLPKIGLNACINGCSLKDQGHFCWRLKIECEKSWKCKLGTMAWNCTPIVCLIASVAPSEIYYPVWKCNMWLKVLVQFFYSALLNEANFYLTCLWNFRNGMSQIGLDLPTLEALRNHWMNPIFELCSLICPSNLQSW